jgi:hypothetical protein
MTTVYIVTFHASDQQGRQLDIGPFSFSTEAKAEAFIVDTVNDEMERRINDLDQWQQMEVMKDEPTLDTMVERYYNVVDEQGESSLSWTLDADIVDLGDVKEARKVFEFV